MSQINAIWQIYLLYGVLIGAGVSGAWVPLVSTIARWFVVRRGLMTGVIVAGIGIGGLIIPPVANWLILTYEWRVAYLILGGVVIVIVFVAAQFLKRDPAQMGLVPYGVNKVEKRRPEIETKALYLRQAVNIRQFWLILGILFCQGFCVYAILVHIVPHAIELRISPLIAANVLATVGGVSITSRVVLGITADRIGNRQAIIIGFILMSGALLWLLQVTSAWGLYLFAAILGFGWGGIAVAQSPLVAELFGLRSHGVIYGVLSLGYTLGASIGTFLAGYLFDFNDYL